MVALIVAIALIIDQAIKLSVKMGMRLYESIHVTDWCYIYFTENPGMAFGTGSHETTRGIIQMLENCITDGCTVLDVGCGSGILAICAAKYGAGLCRAYDIDPVAVRVAQENIADSGEKHADFRRPAVVDDGGIEHR